VARAAPIPTRSRSLAALRSALELGYTHFDTAEAYAAGHAKNCWDRHPFLCMCVRPLHHLKVSQSIWTMPTCCVL